MVSHCIIILPAHLGVETRRAVTNHVFYHVTEAVVAMFETWKTTTALGLPPPAYTSAIEEKYLHLPPALGWWTQRGT